MRGIKHQVQLLFINKDLRLVHGDTRASVLIRHIDCGIGHLSLLKDTKTMNNFEIERVGGKEVCTQQNKAKTWDFTTISAQVLKILLTSVYFAY